MIDLGLGAVGAKATASLWIRTTSSAIRTGRSMATTRRFIAADGSPE
jgi:hypothetical protein